MATFTFRGDNLKPIAKFLFCIQSDLKNSAFRTSLNLTGGGGGGEGKRERLAGFGIIFLHKHPLELA